MTVTPFADEVERWAHAQEVLERAFGDLPPQPPVPPPIFEVHGTTRLYRAVPPVADLQAFFDAHSSRAEVRPSRLGELWREVSHTPSRSVRSWLRSWRITPSLDGLCALVKATGRDGRSQLGGVYRPGWATEALDYEEDSRHGLWLSPGAWHVPLWQPYACEWYAVAVRVADIRIADESGKVRVRSCYTLGRLDTE